MNDPWWILVLFLFVALGISLYFEKHPEIEERFNRFSKNHCLGCFFLGAIAVLLLIYSLILRMT